MSALIEMEPPGGVEITVGMEFPGTLTMTGYDLHPDMTLEEGSQIAQRLLVLREGTSWWLGDLLNQMEGRFGARYAAIVPSKSANPRLYQACADSKWVAGQINFSRRREKLTWSHHREVAALSADEQDLWLQRAETNRWSVHRLRQELAGTKKPNVDVEAPDLFSLAIEAPVAVAAPVQAFLGEDGEVRFPHLPVEETEQTETTPATDRPETAGPDSYCPVCGASDYSVCPCTEAAIAETFEKRGQTMILSKAEPVASAPLVEDRRTATAPAAPVADRRSAVAAPTPSTPTAPAAVKPAATATPDAAPVVASEMITVTIPVVLDDWLFEAGYDTVTQALEQFRLLGDAATRKGKTLQVFINELIEEN